MPTIMQRVSEVTQGREASADKAYKVFESEKGCLLMAISTDVDDDTLAKAAARFVEAHQRRRREEDLLDAARAAARHALASVRDAQPA